MEALAEVRNLDDLREAMRRAKDLRGLSNNDLDDLAGLTRGHFDKVTGPSGVKNFGPLSFNALVWALGIKFVVVRDLEQEAVLADHWNDRQRQNTHARPVPSVIGKAVVERAKPILLQQIGERLAAAFGNDIEHVLLGMKPKPTQPAGSHEHLRMVR